MLQTELGVPGVTIQSGTVRYIGNAMNLERTYYVAEGINNG
jgi:hypothetical protein